MATRDFEESFRLDEEWPAPHETVLPPFPCQETILKALPGIRPGVGGLSKTDFLHWLDFTLEYPDEIWEPRPSVDRRVYHYLSFMSERGKTPVFVVEVCWLDEMSDVHDYSLVTRESDLDGLRSGDLVYCLADEWEREKLVRVLNEQALLKYDEDCLEEADRLIDRAISVSGSSRAYLYNNRGLIHWKMGKTELAKEDFLESIRLDKSNGDPYFNLGLICFDESDFSKAADYLRLAVETNPVDGQFLTELGHVYLELEREDEALQLFGKAVESDPHDPQVDFHLGHYFLYRKNEPRKALKHFDNGLRKDPEDQFAMADLAVAHWAAGNKRKTLGIRRVLQRHSPLAPYAVSRLVYLNLEIGDYECALKYYHHALSHKEPFEIEWLHYHAALVYAKTGRPKQAMDTLDLAVRLGGEAVIKRAVSEKALRPLKRTPAFKKLIKLPAKGRNR